ncbi:hypothetical protein CROQUDRAFT_52408 [Cronartium quercuum f. sp. fusiforme G11]|uniref:Tc1-like transposase DDE domain-containing protein n=1 Tax=Cronartium quercuum f. sp. fusiforme G11 TaxID=708437 RepID=A0A9P6NC24_9BASI|nr:hypothetical protein CROQUDRAFT_52408 [Cronartium quercuum f. sp. fusiforme G11]
MNAYPAEKSILVMDNTPIHHGSLSYLNMTLLTGVWLLYLPAYCPELNPIEMCFSVTKAGFK